jgi:ATP-dependent Clp protease ATP-binding subunit ClpB
MTANMQFTDQAQRALADSAALAEQHAHPQILPIHLALSLYDPPTDESMDQWDTVNASHSDASASLFRKSVEQAHGDTQGAERAFKKALVRLQSEHPPPDHVAVSDQMHKVLRSANDLSKAQKDSFVAVDHLIASLCQDPIIQAALKEANIPNTKLIDIAIQQIRDTTKVEGENENLKKFVIDMTAMARERKIDSVIGREEEIRRVIQILLRKTKNNPVLISESGLDKTAVIGGLAQRIVNADVPTNLPSYKLLSLNVSSLVASSKDHGEFKEHITSILKEIERTYETAVLFIDEIHLLTDVGSSSEDRIDAISLLRLVLAGGRLQCIGATTSTEYGKCIQMDPFFGCQFQQVLIREPTISETISILRCLKEKYEIHHGLKILDAALISAAHLAARYPMACPLPESAVDLVDEAAAAVRVTRELQSEALDNMETRLRHLQIEVHALERERDSASQKRLKAARLECAKVTGELKPLKEYYELEKKRLNDIQKEKKKLDQLNVRRDEAERIGDLQTASDLTYYAIPDINNRIRQLETVRAQAGSKDQSPHASIGKAMTVEAVGPDQINQIVSRQKGIPIDRL